MRAPPTYTRLPLSPVSMQRILSRKAKNLSCTQTGLHFNARCCPILWRRGIRGSPCSPPSPCWIFLVFLVFPFFFQRNVEREQLVPINNVCHPLHQSFPRHRVVRSNAVDGQHCSTFVQTRQCLHHMCHAFCACSGGQCALEQVGCAFGVRTKFLCQCSGHQLANHIPNHDSSDATIRFLHSHFDAFQNFPWDLSSCRLWRCAASLLRL